MKGQYQFAEGIMTIREFKAQHAPCLPESTIRSHLKAGRNSAQSMLTFRQDAVADGRRGRARQLVGKARFGTTPSRFR